MAALAAIVVIVPGAAHSAIAPLADGSACELHVWPSAGFHTVHFGWLHGGTVDGPAKGRAGYQPMSAAPPSSDRQIELLRKLKPADLLGLSDFITVVHDQALSSQEVQATPTRRVANSPACYAELMIGDLIIQRNALIGDALTALYRFRRFEGGLEPTRTFSTFIQEPLRLLPPAANSAAVQPAMDEVETAYAKALAGFGQALRKPPPSARKHMSNNR